MKRFLMEAVTRVKVFSRISDATAGTWNPEILETKLVLVTSRH